MDEKRNTTPKVLIFAKKRGRIDKPMRRWKLILAIILISAIIFGAAFLLFKETILSAIGNYLVIQDELVPVDVIHVIAGDDYRTEYAIQLYQQDYGKVIFFTGGWCTSHEYYHGEHGMQEALARGVPQEAIAYDDSTVTSTYDEVEVLKAWIDNNLTTINTVIVVSDPFHMRRARWTTRQVLGKEVEILMAPVPFDETPFCREWWENVWSKRYVKDEYLKFFYYIARYRISWGPIRNWLSSLDSN
jgi:uncharacterized SAM-binding protein YcdF (DUF218 family)